MNALCLFILFFSNFYSPGLFFLSGLSAGFVMTSARVVYIFFQAGDFNESICFFLNDQVKEAWGKERRRKDCQLEEQNSS
jgi:hypothetical protein